MIRRWRLIKKPKQKVNEEGRKAQDWFNQKVPDNCKWLLSSVLVVNGDLFLKGPQDLGGSCGHFSQKTHPYI